MTDEDQQPEDNPAVDGVIREYARTGGPGDDERFIAAVKRGIEFAKTKVGRERDWPWMFSGGFWKIAAAAAFLFAGGLIGKSVLVHNAKVDPTEVYVFTQPRIEPGEQAAVRVFVREAHNYEPVPEAKVRVTISGSGIRQQLLGEIETDANGVCNLEADLAEGLAEGNYTIDVSVGASTGRARAEQTVTVARTYRTMLSTDKPLYQPGQIIHMRALSMATDSLLPASGRPVVFEVRDAKGNKVFRKNLKTSDFGIGAADFKLANQVNEGSYTIMATVGDTTSERTVNVERYTLPRFKIDLATDRNFFGPRDVVKIDLDANYTFGKPVANAEVVIHAEQFVEKFRPFQQLQGKTDAEGRVSFEIPLRETAFVGQPIHLGDAFVRLRAEVTDATGETRQQTSEFTVTTSPLRVEVFPESGELVQGVDNTLYFVATYADGSPTPNVRIVTGGTSVVHTNELGIAKVTVRPTKNTTKLTIAAEDEKTGARLQTIKELRLGETDQGILLRPDRAVYRQGQTANLTVLSATPARRVFLDVVKGGRSFATTTIEVEASKGSYALDLPPDLAGTVQLQAYAILPSGEIARDTKLIQVHRAQQLLVEAKLDAETYKPAEKAMIQFLVKSQNGDPVEAALSLSAVDEAVFALSDSRPGLEEMYFLIQEEILKPRYQFTAFPRSDFTAIPEDIDPLAEEANTVAFAGSAGADAGPAAAASDTIHQRYDQIDENKRAHGRAMLRLLPLVPFWLMVAVSGFFLAYAFSRVRHQPAGVQEKLHIAEFRRKMLGFFFTLIGCLAGIPLILLFLGWTRMLRSETSALVLIGLLTIFATVGLAVSAGVLRRLPHVERNLRLFRKTIGLVPAGFGLGGFVVVGFIWAHWLERSSVSDEMAITLTLVSIGVILLIGSLILFLRGALSQIRSVSRNVISLAANAGVVLLAPIMPVVALFVLASSIGGCGTDHAGFAADAMFAEETASMVEKTAGPTEAADAGEPPHVRRHFPETLLWQPQLVTDTEGRAQLEIDLADSITTWRLAGSAVSRSGELGSFQQGIRVFQDFFIDIDFPTELTQNDEVAAPIAIFNYLDEPQTIQLEARADDWFEFVNDSPAKSIEVEAGGITSASFRIRALKPGRHALTVSARGTTLSDAVERSVRVKPDGLRVEQVVNDRLTGDARVSIEIPGNAIEGGSDLFLKIYPGAFSQVVEGMDSIFRMPNGCFEQTSSTTYPNVLVLNYLQETKQAKPELEIKALDFIAQGYQRLLSYEVDGGGFDWFGNPPAHSILTAYGLMEFVDMAKVYDVDPPLISRTREWLLTQSEGDGSFKPSGGGIAEGAINHFQGDKAALLRSTAYIAWAIAEADGARQLAKTFDYLAREADGTNDPYTLALCANAFASADRKSEAREFLKQLDKLQKTEADLVWWESDGAGPTYSMGDSLAIETTALVVQAMLKTNTEIGTAHKALAWLISKRDAGGTWFSTQATVQAMRALLLGASSTGKFEGEANVRIAANGAETNPLEINEENADVFHLVSLTEHVRPGTNEITLGIDAGANLAYQIVAVHHEPRGGEAQEAKQILEIDSDYSLTTLATDDLVKVRVKLRYNRPGAAPMTLVDLGIPPGFEIEARSFQQLLEAKVIQRFEPKGRQVTLYFDSVPGDGEELSFEYTLRAKFPVKAQAPANVAYQYYEPEVRDESETVLLTVE